MCANLGMPINVNVGNYEGATKITEILHYLVLIMIIYRKLKIALFLKFLTREFEIPYTLPEPD